MIQLWKSKAVCQTHCIPFGHLRALPNVKVSSPGPDAGSPHALALAPSPLLAQPPLLLADPLLFEACQNMSMLANCPATPGVKQYHFLTNSSDYARLDILAGLVESGKLRAHGSFA